MAGLQIPVSILSHCLGPTTNLGEDVILVSHERNILRNKNKLNKNILGKKIQMY
jgi:hypothetical protein